MITELVEEGLDYFEKTGDRGDKAYVAAIRLLIKKQQLELEELRHMRNQHNRSVRRWQNWSEQ